MRAARGTALVLALTVFVIASAGVSAHRRDEYLQAARLDVEPGRVTLELDLTPGIAVADAIIAEIDRNLDGLLAADERRAYVERVLAAIHLAIDGQPFQVEPITSTFPSLDALRRGEGTIQLQSAVAVPRLSVGGHRLFFRNTHRRAGGVYLANALVPESDRIAITAQRRDAEQHDLTVDYVVRTESAASTDAWLPGAIAAAVMFGALMTRVRRGATPFIERARTVRLARWRSR